MKIRMAFLVFAAVSAVSLGAQQASLPLADSRGITSTVQYPADWSYTLADAPGFYVFAASPETLGGDPMSIPDLNTLMESGRPFVMAALADEKNMGQADWLQTLQDLADGGSAADGEDVVRSEASMVYDSPGRLLVFNDAGTKQQGYLASARTGDGRIALFLAFCPTADAADYTGIFAAMKDSFLPAAVPQGLYGYARVETGSLSIHKPGDWSAFHIESPQVEVAMFAKGELNFQSFNDFDSDQIQAVYPLAMVMRGPADAVFGEDIQDAPAAIEQLISNLGSADDVISRSSVDLGGNQAERVVANASIDTSDGTLDAGLYVVVSMSPGGEGIVFLGLAPQEGFAETRQQFEEMSASLSFRETPRR